MEPAACRARGDRSHARHRAVSAQQVDVRQASGTMCGSTDQRGQIRIQPRKLQTAQDPQIVVRWAALEPRAGQKRRGDLIVDPLGGLREDERVVPIDAHGADRAGFVHAMHDLGRRRDQPAAVNHAGQPDAAVGIVRSRRGLDVHGDEELAFEHTALATDRAAGASRQPDARRTRFAPLRDTIRVSPQESFPEFFVGEAGGLTVAQLIRHAFDLLRGAMNMNGKACPPVERRQQIGGRGRGTRRDKQAFGKDGARPRQHRRSAARDQDSREARMQRQRLHASADGRQATGHDSVKPLAAAQAPHRSRRPAAPRTTPASADCRPTKGCRAPWRTDRHGGYRARGATEGDPACPRDDGHGLARCGRHDPRADQRRRR